MKPRLVETYNNDIVPKMMQSFKYKNKLQVPRLVKVVVNMGVGEAIQDIKLLDQSMEELALITGQRPAIRRAKKAISNFKIRDGQPIGCKVTLRRKMMYEFMDRLLNIALPRIRDFSGVPAESFDRGGNYSFGIVEQAIFPELEHDDISRVQGLNITIVTTAKSKEETKELLRLFGLPFKS